MNNKYQIFETDQFDLISETLHNSHDNALILLDIDDTIITPKSHIFRADSKYKTIVDDMKKQQHEIPDFIEKLENWRRNRAIMLIDEKWPALIDKMIDMNRQIYALTQMHTGRFGNIEKMEDWRYQELLNELDISFIEEFDGRQEWEVLPDTDFNQSSGLSSPSVFYRGYFMTGGHGKDDVLKVILDITSPSEIIFVDDRNDHVNKLYNVSKENDIKYTGIVYKGAELVPGDFDEELAEFQKDYWLKHSQWLEDDEARRIMTQ